MSPASSSRPFSGGTSTNKFGAKKVRDPEYGVFDSKREHQRWYELLTLQKAGHLSNLERQVSYDLVVNDVHIAGARFDFRYNDSGGRLVVEDVKGHWNPKHPTTQIFRIKCSLMEALHGIQVQVVK